MEDGIVTLTTNGSTVVGRADVGLSQYLLNGDASTGVWVTEIDPASYRGSGDDTGVEKFLAGLQRSASPPMHTLGGMSPMGASAGHTVDLLILYSQKALFRIGALDPSPYIANLVADANQSFNNSSVDGGVRVVGYQGISGYVEPVLHEYDATMEIAGIKQDMELGQGYFSNVPDLRDAFHADAVMMFVDGTRLTEMPCGVSKKMSTNIISKNYVYIVLSTECATGDRTFTHELGHVLSGRHDIELGPTNYNPYNSDFGYASSSPSFRTIMASTNVNVGGVCNIYDGCPRVNRWSSLTQSYAGEDLGKSVTINGTTYSSDMVSTLADTIPIVAAYRSPSGLAVPGTPGVIDSWYCANTTHIMWNSANGVVGWYQAEWSTSGPSGPYVPVYKGPRTLLSAYISTGRSFRVKACNANGCGAYAQLYVPSTGSGCEMMGQ